MRAFVALSVLAVVSAGQLGYNYQLGVSGSGPGSVISGSSGSVGSGSDGSFNIGIGTGPNSGIGLNSNPGFGGGSELNYGGSGVTPVLNAPVVDGGLNKEFYLYTAPEEEFRDVDASRRVATSLKKNLRVVFIKAPENNGLENAALQLAKQATNDKTAIYVLSKQPDISELADQVQRLRESGRQKPEVRFIKYRTPEDAVNAQRTIQQQYDALGGSSQSSNEGIAPVLNFASPSQLNGRGIGGGDLGGGVSASNLNPSGVIGNGVRREYLPAIVY